MPDLSGVCVVLPSLAVAPDLARALHEAAGQPLLLPRMTTLAAWTAEIVLDRAVATRAAREATLYQALAQRGWLPQADLWSVARELAQLFDELTRHAVQLPDTPAAFAAQLERAYRTRQGAALQFEARLVHELWHAVTRDTRVLDPGAAYPLRLAGIAAAAVAPLYGVGLGRLSIAEHEFFTRYAERAPVCLLTEDPALAGRGMAQALALAWPQVQDGPDLSARAAALRAAQPQSPCTGRLYYVGAAGAEQEAHVVDVMVRQWLVAGRQRIAVVVNDRLTARRARALLERAQVLVRDESGWAFSTTSAATVIGRWLDVAANDAHYRDLLDLLKSPFVFHDWPRDARQHTVWQLERQVRDANLMAGLPAYIALAEAQQHPEARQLLLRVQRGLGVLGRGRRTLLRWLQALRDSLDEIGVIAGLAADQAGTQLLELLAQLEDDLADNPLVVDFSEWRRWLSRELETATFSDRSISSPVVFTGLAAARLRRFDAVLIVGADAAHLPAPDSGGVFFNQGVRAQLGLPTRGQAVADTEAALVALIAGAGIVGVTWQRHVDGEANLLAAPFERLQALHRLAYGHGLELPPPDVAELAAAPGELPQPAGRPAPPAAAALLPVAMSASAYNALMACPYQFHVRYLLRLAELDDVQELIDKSDYGQAVHGVLHAFHSSHPRVDAMPTAAAISALEALSTAAFAAAVGRNYLARAWLERWRGLIPDYVRWQTAREAEGWRWQAGEARRELVVTTPRGAQLRIHGRIDRVDAGDGGAVAVIDYKTQRRALLRRKKERPGEDVQLPVYALLWGGPVAAALFLSIEREGVSAVPLEGDLVALAEGVRDRLAGLYDELRGGAPLPAQGIPAVCDYCEARGLCRRDYWA